ncbi:hypothetical protein BJ912DRAFT_1143706, partial [Pholiota molesta]
SCRPPAVIPRHELPRITIRPRAVRRVLPAPIALLGHIEQRDCQCAPSAPRSVARVQDVRARCKRRGVRVLLRGPVALLVSLVRGVGADREGDVASSEARFQIHDVAIAVLKARVQRDGAIDGGLAIDIQRSRAADDAGPRRVPPAPLPRARQRLVRLRLPALGAAGDTELQPKTHGHRVLAVAPARGRVLLRQPPLVRVHRAHPRPHGVRHPLRDLPLPPAAGRRRCVPHPVCDGRCTDAEPGAGRASACVPFGKAAHRHTGSAARVLRADPLRARPADVAAPAL